jgi:hypothetical protein
VWSKTVAWSTLGAAWSNRYLTRGDCYSCPRPLGWRLSRRLPPAGGPGRHLAPAFTVTRASARRTHMCHWHRDVHLDTRGPGSARLLHLAHCDGCRCASCTLKLLCHGVESTSGEAVARRGDRSISHTGRPPGGPCALTPPAGGYRIPLGQAGRRARSGGPHGRTARTSGDGRRAAPGRAAWIFPPAPARHPPAGLRTMTVTVTSAGGRPVVTISADQVGVRA